MKSSLLVTALLVWAAITERAIGQESEILWYRQPAGVWTEALPLGNGRLGVMVFGKPTDELLQLNESTLWSGGPVHKNINPESPAFLPLVRKALVDEDYERAIALTKKMQGRYTESYLPMADLLIHQELKDTVITSYYRELNLRHAVNTTKYTADGINYTRQVFSSAPDQVIVVRITANKPGMISLHLATSSLLHTRVIAHGNNELVMKGKAPAHVDPSYLNTNSEPVIYDDTSGCNGMRFEMILRAVNTGGKISADSSGIEVKQASELLLFLSAATSFNGYDKCPDKEGRDEDMLAKSTMQNAASKQFSLLLNRHKVDYARYYERVSLKLTDTVKRNNPKLPSDARLVAYGQGAYDPGIETLYFNFGRYLLISSSRAGGTPANLQGIWNKELRAPWSSNFTININTQMNYWPAEVLNLPEMHAPLFELIRELSVTGKGTAREFYGLNGWVAHHNSDLWAASNPVGEKDGSPRWANWAQGGNWLCQHLWEHYAFTRDTQFLRHTAYPLMKGATEFCLDWLVEDKDGHLVVAPSVSPENVFLYAPGKESDVSVATTMDMSIIWDLFTNMIEASEVLGTDTAFRNLLKIKKAKLFPLQIGRRGNLQEWNKDWDDVEVHHRHVSHLFGLHPGRQISPVKNPALAAAARKTLEIRGDDGTGWSKAWKINFWARLLDGNHAYSLLRQLLKATKENDFNYSGGGGTYPDFFDAHPPFQIDGNFGGIAGMAEMLVQSHLNEIHLLAALPDAWKDGSVQGIKARGNFILSIHWKNHQLRTASIRAVSGGACNLRTAVPVRIQGVKARSIRDEQGYMTRFKSQKGKTYLLSPIKSHADHDDVAQ